METALLPLLIIVAGLVLGGIARLILPGSEDLSVSATIVIGIAGAGVGSIFVNLLGAAPTVGEFSVWTVVGGIVGSVVVLLAVVAIRRRYFTDHQASPPRIVDLVANGESATVEFKSTARVNLHTGRRDDAIELAVVKTVAAFLNSDGGHLVIGVDDTGAPLGLDRDLATVKQPDLDRLELWIVDLLQRSIGTTAATAVAVRFAQIDGLDVAVLDVAPSDRPVYVNMPKTGHTADFYVRVGNSTRKLKTDEFDEYRQTRWR